MNVCIYHSTELHAHIHTCHMCVCMYAYIHAYIHTHPHTNKHLAFCATRRKKAEFK